jgi:hypothetical protein
MWNHEKKHNDILHEVLPKQRKEVESSIFAFCDEVTLVSYAPKKNRTVILLSTEHHDRRFGSCEMSRKLDIFHYNATNEGVNTVDKMVNNYSTRRRSSSHFPFF